MATKTVTEDGRARILADGNEILLDDLERTGAIDYYTSTSRRG